MFEQYGDIVDVRELCQMLKIGRNTAYGLLKTGEIQSVKIGTKYLIPKIYILAYLRIQNSLHIASEGV